MASGKIALLRKAQNGARMVPQVFSTIAQAERTIDRRPTEYCLILYIEAKKYDA